MFENLISIHKFFKNTPKSLSEFAHQTSNSQTIPNFYQTFSKSFKLIKFLSKSSNSKSNSRSNFIEHSEVYMPSVYIVFVIILHFLGGISPIAGGTISVGGRDNNLDEGPSGPQAKRPRNNIQ